MKKLFIAFLLLGNIAYGQTSVLTLSPNPTTSGNDNSTSGFTSIEVAMVFNSGVSGNIIGAKYYHMAGMTGVRTAQLFTMAGNPLAQVNFPLATTNGWQSVNFTTPVTIAPFTNYMIAVFQSDGTTAQYIGGFNSDVVNYPLTAPATTSVSSGNGVAIYCNTPTFPTVNCSGYNFGVDAIFSTGGNQSPQVFAGNDITITLPQDSVTLTATASDDVSVASTSWTRISGPNTPSLSGATTLSLHIAPGISGGTRMIAGTYVYRFSATDGNGTPLTSTDDITITVNPAATISAGADQSLTAGTTSTTLTGSVPATDDSTTLYVFGPGESNEDGFASNAGTGNQTYPPSNQLGARTGTLIFNYATNTYQTLNIGVNQHQDRGFQDNQHHGPELALANQVDSGHLKTPTYLVKIAIGGSYIKQWLPGGDGGFDYWADEIWKLDSALAVLKRIIGPKIRIVVWQWMGTNDYFGSHETSQANFVTHMQAAIANMRSRYAGAYGAIEWFGVNYKNISANNFPWAPGFDSIAVHDKHYHVIPSQGITYEDGDPATHRDYHGFQVEVAKFKDSTNKIFSGGHTIHWRQLSGLVVSIVNPTSQTTAITGFTNGNSYTFELSDTTTGLKDTAGVTIASAGVPGTGLPQLTTDFVRPDAGAENWGGRTWDNSTSPMIPAGNSAALNYYDRFNWTDIESTTTKGVYDWSIFDARINKAIDNGAKFSFRIMAQCTSCGLPNFGYPTWLHNLMQAEATNSKDWLTPANPAAGYGGGDWTPNWNSPNFLTGVEDLLNAVALHIATTSYKGKAYKDAIGYVDIGIAGDFGEWHTYPYDRAGGTVGANAAPTGRRWTDASLQRIMAAHVSAFPTYPLMIPMGIGEQGNYGNISAATFGYWVNTRNLWGNIGWRRDNLGDDGYDANLVNNDYQYNGLDYSTYFMSRYKVAMVGGEPANDQNGVTRNPPGNGTPYGDIVREVNLYHMNSFGNGNYYTSAANTSLQTNIRAGSAAAGGRITIDSLQMNSTVNIGGNANIVIYWKNKGVCPVYDKWTVKIQLRDAGNTVRYTQNSDFDFKLFWKSSGDSAFSDILHIPSSLAAGNYSVSMIITDPYYQPYPLAITGRASDGSYPLKNIIAVVPTGTNAAPTVNAGKDSTIQAPASTITITGVANDQDGTIASYAWTKLSGTGGAITSPTSASTGITGLTPGVYVFQLTATDNSAAIATDQVQVTVTAANIAPVIVPIADLNVTSASIVIAASASDVDGTISTYAWSQTAGSTSGVSLTNTNTAQVNISGLTTGSRTFRCIVTDNNGATSQVLVIVNSVTVLPWEYIQAPVRFKP